MERDTFREDFFLYTAGSGPVLARGRFYRLKGQALPQEKEAKQHGRKEMSAHMSIWVTTWHGPCNWKPWNRGSDEPQG
jgi:hypothetical protein